jgi:phosphatidylglycerophosphatase A
MGEDSRQTPPLSPQTGQGPLAKLVEGLATGFWIGHLPRAPGTFGTLLAVPVVALLQLLHPLNYIFALIVILLLSIAVCEVHEMLTGRHDCQRVVIDEVVGYIIAMTWLPATWQSFAAAFVLFRFFDILKPFPIRQIDQRVRGGLGTVLDDVAAGLIANVVLQVVYTRTDWLGAQLVFR